jgi:serine/threonine protein kinase
MCSGALRLLYQQPSDRHLSDERALTLKRIVEAASHSGPDDSTIAFDENGVAKSSAEPIEVTSPMRQELSGPADHRAETAGKKLTPGDVLEDRFVLEEALGSGGIGVVYSARDRLSMSANAGAGRIAVKVLRQQFQTDPELSTALQREVFHAQKLSHPNIVRVHDFHQDGETCFLTMELLEGELLRTMLSRLQPATAPGELAIRIIAGMCRGLAHAHARGLVHADFKPGNVILTTGGEPKILDFGLAQVARPDGQADDALPRPASKGLRAITPAYASCNRLEGGAPSFSDDVYSLSCVVYELLAGRHPYDKKSALVARELNLQPKRIKGLTDLQWRTLAAGLKLSRQDRTTEVYDLQEAFSGRMPVEPLSEPSRKRGGRAAVSASAFAGLLLGAGLVSGMAMLGIQPVPSKYVDLARESKVIPIVRSTLDSGTAESSAPVKITSMEPSPDIDNGPATPVMEEAVQELDDSLSAPIDAPVTMIAATPGFQLDSAEYFVRENSTALAVQINRQGDISTEASVEWTTVADSAEPQLDYAGFDRRLLLFEAGEKTKTVFIPIISDATAESDENFQVALGRPGGDMILAQPFTATVTIIDDDV